MQFFDEATIRVKSGRGGDGSAAGRREAYVAYGGPSGGDGGDGGSVYLQASSNEYTLMPYRASGHFSAKNGEHGKGKDQYGSHGDDRILKVPIGTHIKDQDTGELVGVMTHHDQRICVAPGGRGGMGNKHFVDAKKQRSTIALLGEPQIQRVLMLELQLLADVGLVGAPSVGKSSLINTISNTKARVAQYHFTTLTPNLGVVGHRDGSFTMIDIPGLIQGASEGKGLGNAFLRHVQKASLLALVIDMSRYEPGIDEAMGLIYERQDYLTIQYGEGEHTRAFVQGELISTYTSPDKTITKKRCIVCTKNDLIADEAIEAEYCQTVFANLIETIGDSLTKKEFDSICFCLSSATRRGVDPFLDYCLFHLEPITFDEYTTEGFDHTDHPPLCERLGDDIREMLEEQEYLPAGFTTKNQIRKVTHPDLTYLTFALPRGNDEAELRYRQRLEELGILRRMQKKGLKKGDIFLVQSPYKSYDERWVRRE